MLRKNASEVFRLIDELKGHLYVCGDIKMASEVETTLEDIITTEGKMTRDEAKAYLSNMRVS